MQKSTDSKTTTTSEENFKVVGKLRDRSDLSDEMKDLCAKLPIYRIRKLEKKQNDDAHQMEDDVEQSDEVDDAPERVARGNKMIKWKSRSWRSYNNNRSLSPAWNVWMALQYYKNEPCGIFTFFKELYAESYFNLKQIQQNQKHE